MKHNNKKECDQSVEQIVVFLQRLHFDIQLASCRELLTWPRQFPDSELAIDKRQLSK